MTKLVLVLSLSIAWPLIHSQETEKNAKGKEASKEERSFTSQSKPFTGDRHAGYGVECKGCHGEVEKKQPVSGQKCLECHTSYEEVAARTKDLAPNPHKNHLIEGSEVACTDCHHGHKPNEVTCHSCHQELKFEKKAATK